MIDAAILDGDWVAMRRQPNAANGVIIVAMINDEATVKTLRRVADRAWLMLQNPVYDPIPAQKAEILGKVATVLRRLCPVPLATVLPGRGASLCRAEALARDTDGIHPDEVLGFALYPGLKADVADRRTLGLGIHLMRRAPH